MRPICATISLLIALAFGGALQAQALKPAGETLSTAGLPKDPGVECVRIGQEGCDAVLVLTARSTTDLFGSLQSNPDKSGTILNVAFQNDVAEPPKKAVGNYYFFWLHPGQSNQLTAGNYTPPWNRMRCVDYHGAGDEDYTTSPVTFIGEKTDGFPTIEDPDEAHYGDPDLVIWCPSTGRYANGVLHPTTWSDDVRQGFWCPDSWRNTSVPNRLTAREGILINYPDNVRRNLHIALYGALFTN